MTTELAGRDDATVALTRDASALRRATVLVFGVIALLLLFVSLHRKLNHDENQFIAAAYLFAKDGLLPYLHYTYFHAPYLIPLQALLFQTTDQLLLAGRLVSTACSLITLVLICRYAVNLFREDLPTTRYGIALGSVIVWLGNPLFTYTTGHAWNHDSSVLLGFAATLAFLSAYKRPQATLRMVMAGVLLGLAVGTRLSFLPLVVPFLAGAFLLTSPEAGTKARIVPVGALVLGLALALLPLLALFAAAPDDFLFGNLGYAALNTEYRQVTGYPRAMSLPGKAYFFLTRVFADPGNFFVFLLLGLVIKKIKLINLTAERGKELVFLLGLIPFAYMGSLAPTPSWLQYFYAPFPFVLLAALRGLALLRERAADRKTLLRLFAATVVVCGLRGVPEYWLIFFRHSPGYTVTGMTHNTGTQIREIVGEGKVLTLAPLFPLEGRLEIYQPFATGPFAWRTAPLLSPDDRRRYEVVSPAELDALLQRQPPVAILVGAEREELERPLIDYAEGAGYRPIPLSSNLTLWVLPTADMSVLPQLSGSSVIRSGPPPQ